MAAPPESLAGQDLASWMCLWIGRVTTPLMVIVAAFGLYLGRGPLTGVGAAGLVVGLSMWRAGHLRRGSDLVLPHLVVLEFLASAAGALLDSAHAGRTAPAVLLVMVALFGSPRTAQRFTVLVVVLHVLSTIARSFLYPMLPAEVVLSSVAPAAMFGVLGWVVVEITRRNRRAAFELEGQLAAIQAVVPALERIAEGDLSGEVHGDGDLPNLTRQMQRDLSELTAELRRNVELLQVVAGQAGGNAMAQEKRTERLAEVVHRVRALQQQILAQARSSSDAAQRVARASLDARKSSSDAQKSLEQLTAAARRVATLYAAIKRLAGKSEVLAVNAAIEAHHAGEAGRAFATVAARMQELSEAIRRELATAEALNTELSQRATDAIGASDRATSATLHSTEAAEQIANQASEQLAATEQISEAFSELESFADQIRAETAETRSHAAQVVIAADDLTRQMDRFRT